MNEEIDEPAADLPEDTLVFYAAPDPAPGGLLDRMTAAGLCGHRMPRAESEEAE